MLTKERMNQEVRTTGAGIEYDNNVRGFNIAPSLITPYVKEFIDEVATEHEEHGKDVRLNVYDTSKLRGIIEDILNFTLNPNIGGIGEVPSVFDFEDYKDYLGYDLLETAKNSTIKHLTVEFNIGQGFKDQYIEGIISTQSKTEHKPKIGACRVPKCYFESNYNVNIDLHEQARQYGFDCSIDEKGHITQISEERIENNEHIRTDYLERDLVIDFMMYTPTTLGLGLATKVILKYVDDSEEYLELKVKQTSVRAEQDLAKVYEDLENTTAEEYPSVLIDKSMMYELLIVVTEQLLG